MDYKVIYNVLQEISKNDKIKNSIEDLYLYLHEIDYLINNNRENISSDGRHNEFQYKLQVIEQQIAEIDDLLQESNKIETDYNEYLS